MAAAFQASVAAAAEAPPSPVAPVVTPAAAQDELTVYLAIGVAHTDLVLPRSAFQAAPHLVKTAVDRAPSGDWVIIGWGPNWLGRKVSGLSVLSGVTRGWERVMTLAAPQIHSQLRMVTVPSLAAVSQGNGGPLLPVRMKIKDLDGALRRIDATFVANDAGDPLLADQSDAEAGAILYRSNELYHLVHQCNDWVAEVLRAGGVNVPLLLEIAPASLALGVAATGNAGPAHREPPPAEPPT
jgi:hypothetical protein